MENSITTTTEGPAQLPVSLSNTPMFVAIFGSQNLPESTTIRIYEISRFNSGGRTVATQTTGRQLIGENEEQHPTSEFESSNNQDDQRVMTTSSIEHSVQGGMIGVSTGEITNLTLTEFESSNNQDDQRVMTTSSIEHSVQGGTIGVSTGEITNLTLTENVLSDIENQNESTSINMESLENDSSDHPSIANLNATALHSAPLHDYSNPKIGTYFSGVYPTIATLLSFKFIAQKYSPFDTHVPFMIISIVVYLMAILDFAILFCLYDRLKKPSNQHFSPRHYKILTYGFYILWILAIVLVVPTLFTPQR